jgi:hypothetical protein
VLEELIGADPDAGNEIGPQDMPKSTAANCLEGPVTSEIQDTPEIHSKSASDSAHLVPQLASGNEGQRGQSPLDQLPENQVVSQLGDCGVRPLVPQLPHGSVGMREQPALSPLPEALPAKLEGNSGVRQLDSQLLPGRRETRTDFQDPSPVFENPSPDGRGSTAGVPAYRQ